MWTPSVLNVIVLFYPFYVIPNYMRAGTGTRMLIALAVHPLLLEVTTTLVRAAAASDINDCYACYAWPTRGTFGSPRCPLWRSPFERSGG